jgi:hypothetical protein
VKNEGLTAFVLTPEKRLFPITDKSPGRFITRNTHHRLGHSGDFLFYKLLFDHALLLGAL